ncbi:ribokinase [Lutimonas zeaxanthinifaciens]|uniref:ribokinase n=1 Tax=Lutimonas zeaxanthinifaciens TaxID=3060215 RepID=UPI00265CFA16|nr:ribokinase [Lutimonas sp. YSD2104]WKK65112.1 ribokinase [Lutimonas sp. YSD2104]
MKKILVIGSSNTDLVIKTSQFPVPGETVIGGVFNTFAGGKGANQAVAAKRLGAEVIFLACLGQDDFGRKAIQDYKNEGIDTLYISMDRDHPTGVASIIINEKGENSIVVAPGANNMLSKKDVERIIPVMEMVDIVLVQLEVPLETIDYAIRKSQELNKRVILNPAPAAELNDDLYNFIDVITPNESETELLLGKKVSDTESASSAAQIFLDKGVKSVIITLGERGAFFKNADEEFLIPAFKTDVVDTTAAGDTFNGALAVALSEGRSWREAIRFSNQAAAMSVARLGAQSSIPSRKEVESFKE